MAWSLSLPFEGVGIADLELARRHAAGDPDAFEAVYARYSGLVYGLCQRLSGDPDRALDLAQEVFLRIDRHLGRFHGRSSLKTWIYRVTVNHCRSALARRRPEVSLESRILDGGEEPRAPGPGPEQAAVGSQIQRRLERALAQLPHPFREAVVLRDVEGLTYDEIAEVLAVPLGTVRSRIARGREALRASLGGIR